MNEWMNEWGLAFIYFNSYIYYLSPTLHYYNSALLNATVALLGFTTESESQISVLRE